MEINDKYGHETTDAELKELKQYEQQNKRNNILIKENRLRRLEVIVYTYIFISLEVLVLILILSK